MLKVANTEDPKQNIVAPSVYIDSVVLEKNSATVHYSLIDKKNDWITNNQILDNLSVYVSDGISTEKRQLKTTVFANKIKNDTVKDYASFYYPNGYSTTGSHIVVTAWTGNQNISGTIVQENIVISGTIQKSSYANSNEVYLNKIKDISLLDFNINFPAGVLNTTNDSPIMSDLFVSYRPDKKANFALVFDLKKFLELNSHQYNVLQKNDIYKEICLTSSSIDTGKSYFKKYDLTKGDAEGTKINANLDALLIDPKSKKYLVCIADDNKNIDNRSYFDLQLHLEINDFSSKVINLTMREKIKKHIDFLNIYINFFTSNLNNKNVKDVNTYVFENHYEEYVNNGEINEFVNDISPLCSLITGNAEKSFADLFVSLLHPLNTDSTLLQKLLNFLERLEYAVSSLVSTSLDANNLAVSINKLGSNIFEKRFSVSTDNPYAADFNYDYDTNSGIEIVSGDSLTTIAATDNTSVKSLTDVELTNRKLLECKKYLDNPSISTRDNVADFSAANIFIDGQEYPLLFTAATNTKLFNDLYLNTKQQESGLKYKNPETYVMQLLKDGINIKSLTSRSNNSTNNLLKSTLFDNNKDTSAKSVKYIADTDVKGLYFLLDNSSFVDYENLSGSVQYYASTEAANPEAPKIKFNQEDLKNEDLKARTFLYYNIIYSVDVIEKGELIDVYVLREKAVSSLFTDNLRLLTKCFIVRKKFVTPIAPTLDKYKIEKDLKINILPIYFNRNTKDPSINIGIQDI